VEERDRVLDLINSDLEAARKDINQGNIHDAVHYLTDLYEVARKHELIGPEVEYPGPGQFVELADYLNH
jgi:hypothetical protein